MATLKDTARELGLSPATVSRALNDYPEVGKATRARVREAAERMGYAPNPIARRLVGGRSGLIGTVIAKAGDLTIDPSMIEIVAGLSEELARRDMDLVLHVDPHGSHEPGSELGAYERLLARNTLDGFIVSAPRRDDPRLDLLRRKGVPFAVHGPAGPDDASYDIDNPAVARLAVEHLVGLGHRDIAFLNGPAHLAYARDRVDGFRTALREAGIAERAEMLWHDELSHAVGERLATQLLEEDVPPTAIICSSTTIASGVYAAAEARGLTVGPDVSVIAHDDAPPHVRAEDFRPPLTVTASPLTDACAPLAAMIASRIAEPDAPARREVAPVTLVERESTGPVSARQRAATPR